jgi:hypothetical protein
MDSFPRTGITSEEIRPLLNIICGHVYVYRRKKDPSEVFIKGFPVNKSISIRRRIKFCIE